MTNTIFKRHGIYIIVSISLLIRQQDKQSSPCEKGALHEGHLVSSIKCHHALRKNVDQGRFDMSTCIHDNRELSSTLFSTTHLYHKSKSASFAIEHDKARPFSTSYFKLTLERLYLHLLHCILYILSQYSPKPTTCRKDTNFLKLRFI